MSEPVMLLSAGGMGAVLGEGLRAIDFMAKTLDQMTFNQIGIVSGLTIKAVPVPWRLVDLRPHKKLLEQSWTGPENFSMIV
jgi:hypothetical protein